MKIQGNLTALIVVGCGVPAALCLIVSILVVLYNYLVRAFS